MAKTRQTGQTRSKRRWVSLVASGSLGLGLTLATGCSSTPVASAPPPDPLHGDMVPPGLTQPTPSPTKADAATVTPVPPASANSGVPAFPASFSSSNPATLAAASGQGPLGRPQPLAITNNESGPPFLPGQLNRTAQTPGVLGPSATPKVERVPEVTPANPPTTNFQPNQPIVQPVSATQPTGDDAWSKQLEDRGVINQTRTPIAGGLRLTCTFSRGPGLGLRTVEVEAADYAAAAQAVLQALATQP